MNFVNDGWIRKAQNYDKLSHAGGSCLAVCLLWNIFLIVRYVIARRRGYLPPLEIKTQRRVILLLCGLVIVAGIALEVWQGTHGIGFSWRDVVANVAGVLIAYGAIGGS